MPVFPRLKSHEQCAVIGLVCIRDEAKTTNGLVGINAVCLCYYRLDFTEHVTGPGERSSWWKLHVDAEDALIFLRNKPSRNLLAKETRAENHETHNCDRQDSLTNQNARATNVAVGRNFEYLVEPTEESAEWAAHRLWRFQHQRAKRGGQ